MTTSQRQTAFIRARTRDLWRAWDANGEVKLPDIRPRNPDDPADDPVIMIEARLTFDGTCEYREILIDGTLTDVRVLPD